MKTLILVIILSLLISPNLLAEEVRDVPEKEDIFVSKDKEKKMGDSIAKRVEEKFDEVDDPLIQKRFEDIGKRLAKVCDRQDFVYHFKVLKAKEDEPKEKYYNAFALPGGYIYMFDALIEVLETDDKIAAVTAHELGHICARHSVKRLQGSLGTSALMILAIATAQDSRTVAKANQALGQLMMAYSREDELAADVLSVQYVKDAGFNPEGVLGSLETLQRLRKEGRELRYRYFKSHPYLSERIATVRSEIKGYVDFDSYINLPEKDEDF